VLPGESLRKYGGTAADEVPAASAPPPVRPSSSFKPSTLIEAPLKWDGSGLLPGESLSKHRGRPAEPVAEAASESYPGFSDAPQSSEASDDARSPDNIEEEDFYDEMTVSTSSTPVPLLLEEFAPDADASHLVEEQPAEDDNSSYAPGSGHIEEEVIEEEEFDAPHHHHAKADEHDLEDYEEETLPPSRCAPATWAKCSRKLTSTIASS
jgi:hypothetical protein